MPDYIAAIQEEYRRQGYPIERAGKVQQLAVTQTGIQATEQDRWEYRTKDETWSILVLQDSVVLQTTAYGRFEDFAKHLHVAVDTVLAKTEHDRLGVIQRIGLRYIDLVQPRAGEDYRMYIRSGFHGAADEVFRAGTHRVRVESIGTTDVSGRAGTMAVRVAQNDQGMDLPLDLVGAAPKHTTRAKPNELVTLVDMDHYVEGTFDPATDWIIETTYRLHDHVIETFHEHVVTPAAIEAWK